jgi:hypothetical protein
LIFAASLAGASLSVRYFAATSLRAGPTTFRSTAWQAVQAFLPRRAGSVARFCATAACP